MAKKYITYFSNIKELELGKEKVLMIRDLTPGLYKYEARYVKGLIHKDKPSGKKFDLLYIRHGLGDYLIKDPYYLTISQELGALYEVEPVTKHQ